MGVTKRGSHDPEAPAVSSVSVNHTHRFTVQEKSEFVTLTTATAQILGSLGPVWSRDGSSCHRIFSSGDLGLSRGLFYRPAPPAALLQGPRRTFLQRDKSGSAVERREHAAMHRWAGCWLTHKRKWWIITEGSDLTSVCAQSIGHHLIINIESYLSFCPSVCLHTYVIFGPPSWACGVTWGHVLSWALRCASAQPQSCQRHCGKVPQSLHGACSDAFRSGLEGGRQTRNPALPDGGEHLCPPHGQHVYKSSGKCMCGPKSSWSSFARIRNLNQSELYTLLHTSVILNIMGQSNT